MNTNEIKQAFLAGCRKYTDVFGQPVQVPDAGTTPVTFQAENCQVVCLSTDEVVGEFSTWTEAQRLFRKAGVSHMIDLEWRRIYHGGEIIGRLDMHTIYLTSLEPAAARDMLSTLSQ